jgi:alanine dehydrogenase
MVLILKRTELEKLVSIDEAMMALEDAFTQLASGNAQLPIRSSINLDKHQGWLGIMPAYLESSDNVSTKIVSFFPANVQENLPTIFASVLLNDPKTGKLVSLMDGSYITALRTGGLGGVAAKYLSRSDSSIVGMFGAGVQARTHLIALSRVRSLKKVKVYDPNPKAMESFEKEMSAKLQISIEQCMSAKQAAASSDIITTVSTSTVPVFDGRTINEGTHINAFGSFRPTERELDTYIVTHSKVVVDQIQACLSEAGDILIPIEEGSFSRNGLSELGEVIVGRKKIRTSNRDITVFKSVGLAIQDCAVAALAYRKALEASAGTEVSMD